MFLLLKQEYLYNTSLKNLQKISCFCFYKQKINLIYSFYAAVRFELTLSGHEPEELTITLYCNYSFLSLLKNQKVYSKRYFFETSVEMKDKPTKHKTNKETKDKPLFVFIRQEHFFYTYFCVFTHFLNVCVRMHRVGRKPACLRLKTAFPSIFDEGFVLVNK